MKQLDERKPSGDRGVRSLLAAVDEQFFANGDSDDSSNSDLETMIPSNEKRGRPKKGERAHHSTSPKSDASIKERKRLYNKERKKKLSSPTKNVKKSYTGKHHPTLRTMAEREKYRLRKGHMFSNKEILLLKIKEEANLRGISIRLEKSDSIRVICWSRDDNQFFVMANHSYKLGWHVKFALVREMDVDNEWDGTIPGGKHNV